MMSAVTRRVNCARGHLFAGASFATDQNSAAPIADQADGLGYRFHGRAVAHQDGSPGFPGVSLIPPSALSRQLSGSRGLNRLVKLIDTFAGVKAVVGPGADQFHGKTGGHIIRAKDHGHSRVCLMDCFQYLYIKVRGYTVDQNAVGVPALDCSKDVLQIANYGYIEIGPIQAGSPGIESRQY
jgi:hypothetical protein